jgi:hypothetical protein
MEDADFRVVSNKSDRRFVGFVVAVVCFVCGASHLQI